MIGYRVLYGTFLDHGDISIDRNLLHCKKDFSRLWPKRARFLKIEKKKSKFGVIGGVSLPDTESLPLYVRLGSCSRENKRVEKKRQTKTVSSHEFFA